MEKLQYRLENFEGPLDLLLNLVAKNKIDIYDIPIAELLEQYMEQIDLMREADMDVASEFLEMAARLVYIKTASLLPRQEDEEDPRMELTGILLEYRQCKAAAEKLRQMAAFNTVTRPPEELPADFIYKRIHDPRELGQALRAAWGKGKSLMPPKPESFSALVSARIVSVASQTVYVLRSLWKRGSIAYRALFAEKADRSARVAVFLALLELVKNRRVRVEGEGDLCEVRLLGRDRA
jgi:segregation and condensation protein A